MYGIVVAYHTIYHFQGSPLEGDLSITAFTQAQGKRHEQPSISFQEYMTYDNLLVIPQ